MVSDAAIASVVALVVTASFPFYLYGAWIIIEAETVTWDVLTHHLKFIVTGLLLTTIPAVVWMIPRFERQFGGLAAVHAFLGLQAYAMLILALTGIVRIFQVKRAHDLYGTPNPDMDISELHENMDSWRWRLRAGVAGYIVFWLLTWVLGMARFLILHTDYF
ncbi:hypothetical protein SAMN05421858_1074 [Haladaptatus litoreus]|uniref:DUF7321 domain-containing protein n=1 Tax=Haladaptatus litoreus TaxID=553468 RepID=A0A1N6XBV2_9EURY|nr:hypothetical protein [Haladaptatus litoreus]SIQ99838.1 hypothetical protein SAMN05421858_1074 [Haladaptatus litoreus]